MEHKNYYVSSRGIMKSCDFHSTTPISSIRRIAFYPSIDTLKTINKPLIYVCSSALPHFRNLLPYINYPFILVSGDCDETIPNDIFTRSDFDTFLKNPYLLHWFSQNMIYKHPKITIMPIGLDYHTMVTRDIWGPTITSENQEILLKSIKKVPFYERKIKTICYANFHFQTKTKHGYDRLDAIKQINKDLIYYEPKMIPRLNTWNKQKDYVFVISPHGGGYDCHRLWEALILGCIPIVKTSPIDQLYDDLPVLIVKEWSDITEVLLQETIELFNKYQNQDQKINDKLSLQYWINRMKNI